MRASSAYAGAAIGLMPVGAAEIAIEEAGFGTDRLSIVGLKSPLSVPASRHP